MRPKTQPQQWQLMRQHNASIQQLIAQGYAIKDAIAKYGVSRSFYYKFRNVVPQ